MINKIIAVLVVVGFVFMAGCQPVGGSAKGGKRPGSTSGNSSNSLDPSEFSSEYLQGATLVYFSKPGCPACSRQDPLYQQVLKSLPSGTRATKVYGYMVDLDRYGVDELPTLVVYKDGQPKKRFVGVTSASRLISALEDAAN